VIGTAAREARRLLLLLLPHCALNDTVDDTRCADDADYYCSCVLSPCQQVLDFLLAGAAASEKEDKTTSWCLVTQVRFPFFCDGVWIVMVVFVVMTIILRRPQKK